MNHHHHLKSLERLSTHEFDSSGAEAILGKLQGLRGTLVDRVPNTFFVDESWTIYEFLPNHHL